MVGTLQKWLFWEKRLTNTSVYLVISWHGLVKLALQKPSAGIYIRDAFTSLWKSLEARYICKDMVMFLTYLVGWGMTWCQAVPFQECRRGPSRSCDTRRLVSRHWCLTASPCPCLREDSRDCPSESVIWETDLLPGTGRADISRQQAPWMGILWWTMDWSLFPFSQVELCSSQPVGCPRRTESDTARKRVTKYKAHEVFWAGRDSSEACGGTAGGCWWRPRAASGLTGLLLSEKILSDEGSSLGPFSCKSYLWAVFPPWCISENRRASSHHVFSLFLFLFYTGFQKKCVFHALGCGLTVLVYLSVKCM